MDTWNLSDKNMISGTHIATGYPIDIQLTMQEMILACAEYGDINSAWESMCKLVYRRTGIGIINEIDIEYITVRGKRKKFH